MMIDASVFVHNSLNFQFLSVCHYISSLGIIFHNKGLIKYKQRHQTIPVLNTFFKYLDDSNNEAQTKLELLQTILRGSDLYSGGENEKLDATYVDETYEYIIKITLFSHYDNINIYLSRLLSKTSSITYSNFIEFVRTEFYKKYVSKDYCLGTIQSPELNLLSRKKTFSDYILPMFPKPDNTNMNIIDEDYIYAMAGLKLVRSVLKETLYASFSDYVSIAREFDLENKYHKKEIIEIILVLFSTPAVFIHALKENNTHSEISKNFMTEMFWVEAYKHILNYLGLAVNKIEKIPICQILNELYIPHLQIIDPRFELTFRLSKFGYKSLYKMNSYMLRKIPNDFRYKNLKLLLTSMLDNLQRNMQLSTTFNGLIPNKEMSEENNKEVIQFYYPGGKNFFGPTCIFLSGKILEIRTIESRQIRVPVLPVIFRGNKIYYMEYNLEFGEFSDVYLEMVRNDFLRQIIIPSSNNNSLVISVEITSDYQVLYNTNEWNETLIKKMKSNPTENFNSPADEENVSFLDNSDKHRQFTGRGGLPSDDIPGSSGRSGQVIETEDISSDYFDKLIKFNAPAQKEHSSLVDNSDTYRQFTGRDGLPSDDNSGSSGRSGQVIETEDISSDYFDKLIKFNTPAQKEHSSLVDNSDTYRQFTGRDGLPSDDIPGSSGRSGQVIETEDISSDYFDKLIKFNPPAQKEHSSLVDNSDTYRQFTGRDGLPSDDNSGSSGRSGQVIETEDISSDYFDKLIKFNAPAQKEHSSLVDNSDTYRQFTGRDGLPSDDIPGSSGRSGQVIETEDISSDYFDKLIKFNAPAQKEHSSLVDNSDTYRQFTGRDGLPSDDNSGSSGRSGQVIETEDISSDYFDKLIKFNAPAQKEHSSLVDNSDTYRQFTGRDGLPSDDNSGSSGRSGQVIETEDISSDYFDKLIKFNTPAQKEHSSLVDNSDTYRQFTGRDGLPSDDIPGSSGRSGQVIETEDISSDYFDKLIKFNAPAQKEHSSLVDNSDTYRQFTGRDGLPSDDIPGSSGRSGQVIETEDISSDYFDKLIKFNAPAQKEHSSLVDNSDTYRQFTGRDGLPSDDNSGSSGRSGQVIETEDISSDYFDKLIKFNAPAQKEHSSLVDNSDTYRQFTGRDGLPSDDNSGSSGRSGQVIETEDISSDYFDKLIKFNTPAQKEHSSLVDNSDTYRQFTGRDGLPSDDIPGSSGRSGQVIETEDISSDYFDKLIKFNAPAQKEHSSLVDNSDTYRQFTGRDGLPSDDIPGSSGRSGQVIETEDISSDYFDKLIKFNAPAQKEHSSLVDNSDTYRQFTGRDGLPSDDNSGSSGRSGQVIETEDISSDYFDKLIKFNAPAQKEHSSLVDNSDTYRQFTGRDGLPSDDNSGSSGRSGQVIETEDISSDYFDKLIKFNTPAQKEHSSLVDNSDTYRQFTGRDGLPSDDIPGSSGRSGQVIETEDISSDYFDKLIKFNAPAQKEHSSLVDNSDTYRQFTGRDGLPSDDIPGSSGRSGQVIETEDISSDYFDKLIKFNAPAQKEHSSLVDNSDTYRQFTGRDGLASEDIPGSSGESKHVIVREDFTNDNDDNVNDNDQGQLSYDNLYYIKRFEEEHFNEFMG
ncbi:uncharacterized protein LOC127279605 [Leptopilina boulardi]|uniref:uncharacterized protein LOC127279605 n=1 Tax=Leptopilina boulardi TaxID=63433 RepID=UPI0021F5D393|nr:uncharacterized protein LOC127279605 [Leptopilina boulardi]